MGSEYIRQIVVLGEVPSLGPVMLFDDMEGLFKWSKADGTGDSVFEKSTTEAYNGSACLHMETRTTGAAENDVIGAYRKVYQRPGERYRVELLWMPDAAIGVKMTTWQVQIFDGTNMNMLKLRWDIVNAKWQYWNSAGAWVDVVGGSQNLQVNQFHRLLFEWDQHSAAYLRLVSDGLEKDMAGISFQQSADASALEFDLKMSIAAGGTPPGETYVDDVLVMEI